MNIWRITSALLMLCAHGAAVEPCEEPPAVYEGYLVGRVLVTSPLGFVSAGSYGFEQIATTLPLRAGARFDLKSYSLGTERATAAIRDRAGDPGLVRIAGAAGILENCDAANQTLDVRYVVYVLSIPRMRGGSFEFRQQAAEKPVTSRAALSSAGKFVVTPLAGYNQTRGAFGGAEVRAQALEVNAAISTDSFTGKVGWAQGPWRLAATYRDLPAGGTKLVESKVSAGAFGTTARLRYGASFEGGSSGAGLKLAARTFGGGGPAAWSASYGFQLGSALSGRTVDFAKHVIDLAYTASFVPLPRTPADRWRLIGVPHHPFTVEARLNAGTVQNFARVPLPELFFGGNQKLSFLDAPWDFRGQPFLRSVPEERLGGAGGMHFYAFNLTLAKPVYARPFLPAELGTRAFTDNLDFAIQTAKGELSDSYLAKDPVLLSARAAVTQISAAVDSLKEEIGSLSSGFVPAALASDLGRAARTAASIRSGSALMAPLAGTFLPRLEADLVALETSLASAEDPASAQRIAAIRATLAKGREAIASSLGGPSPNDARKRADSRAEHDLSTVDQVLRSILYELNIYSVAPVAIFDAGRVWPGAGTQYAAGAGIRLSFVNVNFTAGYAANPRPAPGLPGGAAFLQLDISELFR